MTKEEKKQAEMEAAFDAAIEAPPKGKTGANEPANEPPPKGETGANEPPPKGETGVNEPEPIKKTVLISGAEYWDFETDPIFTGFYESVVKREKDETNGEGKAGDIIGFNFVDLDGEIHIISNSYAIEKALLMEIDNKPVIQLGKPFEIEFKGKGENARNQPFNKFKVSLIG